MAGAIAPSRARRPISLSFVSLRHPRQRRAILSYFMGYCGPQMRKFLILCPQTHSRAATQSTAITMSTSELILHRRRLSKNPGENAFGMMI